LINPCATGTGAVCGSDDAEDSIVNFFQFLWIFFFTAHFVETRHAI
jgi:hypothetical protein